MKQQKVIIIGAGISGISAAVKLSQSGFRVIIYESRGYAGGRAYSFEDKVTGEIIDNGQHLLMGAYENFLSLLKILGTINKIQVNTGIKVPFIELAAKTTMFNTSLIPGKLGMLLGLLGLKSINLNEKVLAVDFLFTTFFKLNRFKGLTVYKLLRKYHQSENIIKHFWEPVCLAVMNLNAKSADADVFSEVIRKAFFTNKDNANLIYPRYGLSALIETFQDYLNNNGGIIYYNSAIEEICIENNEISGVLSDGKMDTADHYISAIPPKALKRILKNPHLIKEFDYLNKFSYSTIVSVYLWFDKNFTDKDLYAILNSKIHWIFNRRKIFLSDLDLVRKYPGHIALTISGANDLDNIDKTELLSMLINELNQALPETKKAKLIHSILIRDKFATFKALPEIISLRPEPKTKINNLYLSGDWTNTGLPATLEGACLSGFKAADLIIDKIQTLETI